MIERLRSYMPLNFDLMGNPVNWVIVFLMIAVAGLAVNLIFHPANRTIVRKPGD